MYRKIAFIDDEKGVLESLKWVFRDEPYQLFTFQNPMEAIDRISKDEFAVVVSDHVMPEMEGTSLLEQIKKKWPKTECMIMTGYDDIENVKNADNPVIKKPWDIGELKSAIHNAVAHYEEDYQKSGDLPEARKCILYVDNEESMLNLVKQILERLGYDVVVTNWCSKAIRLLQAQPDMFDLIITDMKMPNMDGMELSRNLLEIRPDIPIILCTGFSDLIDREGIKAAGIKEVIAKPFLMEDMAKVIHKVLGDG